MKEHKALIWLGSSKKDFMEFPDEIRKEMGHCLYVAQTGDKPRQSKVLKGFGNASISEVIAKDAHGTYRTMYTVQMEKAVFVLHAFQKKSKTGIKTPKEDMRLVEQRLQVVQTAYREWLMMVKGD